jgi:hypothetical protein
VNHVKANGGSIDAAGPVIAGGLLLTNSGYGAWRGQAGKRPSRVRGREIAANGDTSRMTTASRRLTTIAVMAKTTDV